MARYTSSYIATVSLKQLPPLLNQILESCEFEVIYQAIDYIMAREIPGKVNFSKLVTVEVLIESTAAKENEVPVNWVIKNDELPLQIENHCQQKFQKIEQAISKYPQWRLIASVSN
jgi:hypothetical protein